MGTDGHQLETGPQIRAEVVVADLLSKLAEKERQESLYRLGWQELVAENVDLRNSVSGLQEQVRQLQVALAAQEPAPGPEEDPTVLHEGG